MTVVRDQETGDLTIGGVARETGVGVEAIRFYERRGLIARPPRPLSGFRRYSPDVVDRIRFILAAKDLGFSLREVKDLLALRVDPKKGCRDVRAHAEAKLDDVERKIAGLRAIHRVLRRLASACPGEGPTSACPILDSLRRAGQTHGARGVRRSGVIPKAERP